MPVRIGIDVGGTNTDAVLMDEARLVAKAKTPTTADVSGGIGAALRGMLAGDGSPSSAAAGGVGAVMVGTTRFTNAVVERRGPAPVAGVRPGLPAIAGPPPRAWVKAVGDLADVRRQTADGRRRTADGRTERAEC